jgi:hypothetical protein
VVRFLLVFSERQPGLTADTRAGAIGSVTLRPPP